MWNCPLQGKHICITCYLIKYHIQNYYIAIYYKYGNILYMTWKHMYSKCIHKKGCWWMSHKPLPYSIAKRTTRCLACGWHGTRARPCCLYLDWKRPVSPPMVTRLCSTAHRKTKRFAHFFGYVFCCNLILNLRLLEKLHRTADACNIWRKNHWELQTGLLCV